MYIYQADVYCDDCIKSIKTDLNFIHEGESELNFDSDDYPKGPFNDSDEADCPQHCAHCHIPFHNNLTNDGVAYVLQSILDFFKSESSPYLMYTGNEYEHYYDSYHLAILADWAEDATQYDLTLKQECLVNALLYLYNEL